MNLQLQLLDDPISKFRFEVRDIPGIRCLKEKWNQKRNTYYAEFNYSYYYNEQVKKLCKYVSTPELKIFSTTNGTIIIVWSSNL